MNIKAKWASYPYIIWMILFTIIPLAMIVYFAFTDSDGGFSFANIQQSAAHIPTLVKSIYLAAISTVVCLVLAYPFAYYISRKSYSKQKMMVMLVMLPMWMNFLLRTHALSALIEDNGVINTLLMKIGLEPIQMINTQGAVVFGMVYNYLPYMIMPLYSIMTKIDGRTVEAAADLGANALQTHRRLILPMSMPGIISGITMVFVPSVSTFVISGLLGGSDNYLIGDIISAQMLGSAYNLNYGSATSLLLMLVVLVTMIIFNSMDSEDTEGMLA
ncbi:MAG: ABC transporter permease [Clostridia bacterium]|nr:ABC transporter permease [Clostridia bacterium]MBQ8861386.1 ABC transporter permease [Clostridia bacterium]